jgi:hypothetical protein
MAVKGVKDLSGKSWQGSKIWLDKDSGGDEKNNGKKQEYESGNPSSR